MIALPPLPDPLPIVRYEACPWQAKANDGCAYAHGLDGSSAPVVFVQVRDDVWLRLHEFGHIYADQRMDAGNRSALVRRAGWPAWDDELAADAYAMCRLRPGSRSLWGDFAWSWGRRRDVSRAWVAGVCGVIRRAFWR